MLAAHRSLSYAGGSFDCQWSGYLSLTESYEWSGVGMRSWYVNSKDLALSAATGLLMFEWSHFNAIESNHPCMGAYMLSWWQVWWVIACTQLFCVMIMEYFLLLYFYFFVFVFFWFYSAGRTMWTATWTQTPPPLSSGSTSLRSLCSSPGEAPSSCASLQKAQPPYTPFSLLPYHPLPPAVDK